MVAFLSSSLIFFCIQLQNVYASTSASAPQTITRKYELYHDLGDGFIPRNSFIALTASADDSWDGSTYSISAELESSSSDNDDVNTTCENESCENMSMEEVAILELMKSGKFYKIKALDVETGMEALTSVHPCSIRKSNFRETFNLILSPKADLISLDYTPIISPILSSVPCHTFESITSSKPFKFTTTSITYTTSTPAMTIPLVLPHSNLPKGAITMLPRDKKKITDGNLNGEDSKLYEDILGNQQDQGAPKSFLMRYWYIILPMVLMSLLGDAPQDDSNQKSSEQTETQAQGQRKHQGQAQGQSPGQTRSAPAKARSSSTSEPVRRRGKRGK